MPAAGGAASPVPPENQHELFIPLGINSLSLHSSAGSCPDKHLCFPVLCPVFFTLVPVPRS